MNELRSHHNNPYGVGLAYRFNVHQEAVRHHEEIDLLEISTEDYLVRERRTYADPDERLLRDALERFPCVAHGLQLSIGTVGPLSQSYLNATRRFMDENGIRVFSEHLAFHSVDGKDLTMFLAMPFEEVSIRWIKLNYEAARKVLGRPFALENVTYHFPVPHCSLDEADFLRRLTEETDCTLLLDVTNVFNNANNHGYDPIEFFDRLPMERVSQMHLAGGHQHPDGRWEDSHSAPVMEPVWPLFEEAVRRSINLKNVILERDSKFHPFDTVMHDIRKAREIFYAHRPGAPSTELEPINEAVKMQIPDYRHVEFADLRAYQRAMMAWISEDQFKEAFRIDPFLAVEPFGLKDPEWIRRLTDSDGRSMHHFQKSWEHFRKEDEEVAREYENREWASWAQQLGGRF
ncbi:MAG: DUF692 domain-containing protein [Verrucomicrobiota bacterium]